MQTLTRPAPPRLEIQAATIQGPRRRALRSFLRNTPGVIALAVVTLMVLAAILAPLVAPQDPLAQRLSDRLLPPAWLPKGSIGHLLGTDQLGRDVLSRIIWGSRPSLLLGFLCSSLSLLLGVGLGLVAGLTPRRWGAFIMRVADAWQAFPALVLVVAAMAILGTSFTVLIALLSISGWAGIAKVARSQVLSVRTREYVQAARLLGARPGRVAIRHVLPNIVSPLFVLYTFSVAAIILVEAGLSFLGFGIQPPTPAWGSMLADGQNFLETAWWLGTFPGVAILLTVLSVNVLGDALRDVLDPQAR